jgi:hypothetical protein
MFGNVRAVPYAWLKSEGQQFMRNQSTAPNPPQLPAVPAEFAQQQAHLCALLLPCQQQLAKSVSLILYLISSHRAGGVGVCYQQATCFTAAVLAMACHCALLCILSCSPSSALLSCVSDVLRND